MVFAINAFVAWRRRKKSYELKIDQSQQNSSTRKTLKGKKGWLYSFILSIPILFGFILPVVQLVYWAILTFSEMFNAELFWIALQSIGVALSGAFFIVITSIALIYFTKWNHLKSLRFFKKMVTIGYVLPGAIIGIGIIRSSQSIIDFFSDTFGLKIGFLFYGSSFILVYAYIFRFLAVAFNPMEANSLKIGKNLGEASQLLGINKLKTLLKVELPLLRNVIISAFVLVFIDILKELPLTLILKPYNLNTLAVTAYAYADDERVAEAALPALVLIFIIVVLMILLSYAEKTFLKAASKTK
jgi:iron(III) transport system permease protein